VLQRSLATSFCTALPILALLLFGGDTLKDFAFALLIGTISGAYSSIFIASPVLTHWKEREPTWEKRARRIYDELGEVPAYATAIGGAPVDIAPKEKPKSRRAISAEPEEVSASEFQEMVRDLGVDEDKPAARQPAAAGAAGRPVGGRRARARAQGGGNGSPPTAGPSSPSSGNGEDGDAKDRKPRNRRHGRPR